MLTTSKPHTFAVLTFGCKVNQYESEAIAEYLEAAELIQRPAKEACDLYIVTTCTVTAESDRKARQTIRRLIHQHPSAFMLVTGCSAQARAARIASIAGVDAVVGNLRKLRVAEIALELLQSGAKPAAPIVEVDSLEGAAFEPMSITHFSRTRAYVKIEDGCESRCAYCAIPAARGPIRSKPLEEVIREVTTLTEGGCREIVLTGIETGSYGQDFDNGYRLADLIAELDSRHSAERIRLGSLAPELVGAAFVDKIKDLSILAPHFHLSIQSGSDNVLRGMKRRYNRAMALENIERIRKNVKGATFTTDIMVGFPGETDEDFRDTVDFVRRAEFLDAHVFAYSKRKNTPAESYPNQVPESTKRARSEELIQVVAQVRKNTLEHIVQSGEELSVIFEERRDGRWYGHSASFAEVIVESDEELHGEIKNVIPLRLENNIIIGKIH